MTGNGFYIPPIKMVKLVDGLRHCFIYAVFVYAYIDYIDMYPLVNEHNYGKSPFLMGKSTISMAIFHSFLYVYQRVYRYIRLLHTNPSGTFRWSSVCSGGSSHRLQFQAMYLAFFLLFHCKYSIYDHLFNYTRKVMKCRAASGDIAQSLIELEVSLPSGRCATVSVLESGTVADLKRAAQKWCKVS